MWQARLLFVAITVAALALPSRSPLTATTPSSPLTPAAMERALFERINKIRAEHQRLALRLDETLARVARQYSCDLARRHTLSHTSPAGRGIGNRVRAASKTYTAVGENLATNTNAQDPVATAVEGWLRSPGHRENILRPEFTETGLGACRDGRSYYFTQVFLTPARTWRPPAPSGQHDVLRAAMTGQFLPG